MGAKTLAPVIGNIRPNSVAAVAGLQTNDEIIRINDIDIKSWDEIGKVITSSEGSLQFYIKRDNQIILKTINPVVSDSQNMFNENIFASTMIFQGVQKLISGVIPSSEIGGVITIGKVISDASESSLIALLTITALISVNLGVLNLLPIPALDGGHIMFNLYEMIMRKKPSDQVFMFLTIMGWLILGSLMLLGIYNDINRIFLNN